MVATAPGFGPGRLVVGHLVETPGEVTVQLVADDLPIEGRVVNLEGRPVAGASIRVSAVFVASSTANLSKWLDKAREYGTRGPWEGWNTGELAGLLELPGVLGTTGPDGRFRLNGIGRDRIAILSISGPGIATAEVHVLTRPGGRSRRRIGGPASRA